VLTAVLRCTAPCAMQVLCPVLQLLTCIKQASPAVLKSDAIPLVEPDPCMRMAVIGKSGPGSMQSMQLHQRHTICLLMFQDVHGTLTTNNAVCVCVCSSVPALCVLYSTAAPIQKLLPACGHVLCFYGKHAFSSTNEGRFCRLCTAYGNM
jgi:hypothetical protein